MAAVPGRIDVLRANGLPSMPEHADRLVRQLDQHAPDEAVGRLILTDDVYHGAGRKG